MDQSFPVVSELWDLRKTKSFASRGPGEERESHAYKVPTQCLVCARDCTRYLLQLFNLDVKSSFSRGVNSIPERSGNLTTVAQLI